MPYLFKRRQTQNVARTIARLARNRKAEWQDAGQRWSGVETALQLQGWTRQRRMQAAGDPVAEEAGGAAGAGHGQREESGAGLFARCGVEQVDRDWYEYAVLATSWEPREVRVLAQAYRDRADAENMFDELSGRCRPSGFGI